MAKRSREEIDHYVLDQFEQERHLGIGHERTKNLGHDWRESEIEKNPAGRVMNYDSADTSRVINEPRSVGVYQKFSDPKSGLGTSENLSRWSDYARSNSYHTGPGREPSMRDPRGRHSNESDGYLASTKNWPSFDYGGAESGEGRLQKIHRK